MGKEKKIPVQAIISFCILILGRQRDAVAIYCCHEGWVDFQEVFSSTQIKYLKRVKKPF